MRPQSATRPWLTAADTTAASAVGSQAIIANHEATHRDQDVDDHDAAPPPVTSSGDAFIAATLPTVLLGLSEPITV